MARNTALFEGWSWFKINNLGLALGANLKFYTSVAKGLKLRVRKFWRLILLLLKLMANTGRGAFMPPILNRVKILLKIILNGIYVDHHFGAIGLLNITNYLPTKKRFTMK